MFPASLTSLEVKHLLFEGGTDSIFGPLAVSLRPVNPHSAETEEGSSLSCLTGDVGSTDRLMLVLKHEHGRVQGAGATRSRGFGVRREAWNLEDHCLVTRESEIHRVHMMQVSTRSGVCVGCLTCVKQVQRKTATSHKVPDSNQKSIQGVCKSHRTKRQRVL